MCVRFILVVDQNNLLDEKLSNLSKTLTMSCRY
jgi:hypothetical protein